MNRSLDALDPRFRPIAFELLARFVEARIPVLIVNTLRTEAEQQEAIATGHSWVQRSRHQDGMAIDVVPYEIYTSAPGGDKLNWNTSDPVWEKLGVIGEKLGLIWGGRWTVRDCAHFEYVELAAPPQRSDGFVA